MSEPLNELIVIPRETALEVFTKDGSIDPYLEQIRAAVTGIVPDLSTKKGRDAIASMAYKVAKSKTYLESVGKSLADEQKEIPKKIDATRKRAREFLDQLKDEVRQPLTEWEAEQARIEAERLARIQEIDLAIQAIDQIAVLDADATSEVIQKRIDAAEQLEFNEAIYGDRVDEASNRFNIAFDLLLKALHKRQQYESEQAELAELRRLQAEREQKDREEQIRREAEENARRQAEQQAQAERDAAAKREQDLQAKADQAERDRLAAEELAAKAERDAKAFAERAAEQERQRIAAEQRQAEEEARAREADREHRKAINTAALDAFVAEGITKETAIQVITLIAQRKIPAISIQY